MAGEDMIKRVVGVLIIFAFFVTMAAWAQGDCGAENIDISAGYKGRVPFPHHTHQAAINDCNSCHSVFPQKTGGIGELVDKGELAGKQVMNDVCRKCHKERKAEGLKTGPTACAKCHTK
jgi:hypothetical protein